MSEASGHHELRASHAEGSGHHELRASDAERESAVTRLRAAAAEGRLDADELEQRVGAALAARTGSELDRLLTDLPAPADRPPSRRSNFRLGPEVRTFLVAHAVMIAIWALTGFGYFWVIWPLVGWGAALVLGRRGRCRSRALGAQSGGSSSSIATTKPGSSGERSASPRPSSKAMSKCEVGAADRRKTSTCSALVSTSHSSPRPWRS